MSRIAIFWVQMAWLVFLGGLAAIFFFKHDLISFPPGDSLGPVPLGVVWFGALGAVLISLTGIVEHAHDWDESFALWHLSRPLVGASLAVVGVLIIQAGVLAAGQTPSSTAGQTPTSTAGQTPTSTAGQTPTSTVGQTPTSTVGQTPNNTVVQTSIYTVGQTHTDSAAGIPKNLLYYLVAFLVGYREETFRELIKRLVDLILTPGTKPAPTPTATAPTIKVLIPNTAPAAGGGNVLIAGSGFIGTTEVTFGANPSVNFKVDSDSEITAPLPAGTAGQKVTVTVKGNNGTATASFLYT